MLSSNPRCAYAHGKARKRKRKRKRQDVRMGSGAGTTFAAPTRSHPHRSRVEPSAGDRPHAPASDISTISDRQ